MAGLGTIFVELDLDRKKFSAAEADVLAKSINTTVELEKNWRNLGTKSSQYFDAMRQGIIASHDAIKSNALSTTKDIVRAHEAMTSKLKQLDEQQFGSQKTLIDKAKENWVGLTVGITAAVASMSGITNMIRDVAAAYGEQEAAEKRLQQALAAHGVTNREVTDALSEYAGELQRVTTFSDDAILSAMQLLTTMGTSPDKIKPATEAVLSLSHAYGIDLNQAAMAVAQAMEGNYRGLTKLIPALKGVEAGSMSAADVLKLVQQYTGNIAAQEVTTYQGKLKQLTNSYGELKEQIGGHVVPALKDLIDQTITGIHFLEGLFGAQSTAWKKKEVELLNQRIEAMRKTQGGGDGEALFTRDTQEEINTLIAKRSELEREVDGVLKEQNKTLKDAASSYVNPKSHLGDKQAGKDLQEQLKAASDANRAYYEERIAQEDLWLKLSKIGQYDDLATTAEVIERKKGYLNEWYETQTGILEKQEKNETVLNTKLEALWSDYSKKWEAMSGEGAVLAAQIRVKAENDAIEAMKAEIAMGEKQTMESIRRAQERDQTEMTVLANLKGYEEEYYNLSIKLIDEKAQKMRALGIEEAEVAAWVADQYEEAERRKAVASDNFFEGMLAGLGKTRKEMKTWGEAGEEITKEFSKQSADALSTGLFQAIKTGTVDTQAIFNTFMDAMLRKVCDTVAQMVVQVAAQKVKAYFGTEWEPGGMSAIAQLWGFVTGLGGGGEGGDIGSGIEPGYSISGQGGGYGGPEGGYAYGGRVPGFASGGDSRANDRVRAMLSPGEFVVPRSIMQAIAGKGRKGDTLLAHISPAEASLLKRLGGAGSINEATGLPEFFTRIVGGEAGSNVYYDQAGRRYDITGWNRGNTLGFGLGQGGWMLTPQELAALGGKPTRQQIMDYYDSNFPVYPTASDMTGAERSSSAENNPLYLQSRMSQGAKPYYDETAIQFPYSKEVYDAIMTFRQTRQMPGPRGGFRSWGGQANLMGSMAVISYGFGSAAAGLAGGAGWGTAATAAARGVGSAIPNSLVQGAQGNWDKAALNLILSGATAYGGNLAGQWVTGVTDSAVAGYVAGKLVGLGVKYGLSKLGQELGIGDSPVKVGLKGIDGAQELGNILADFSGRIAPTEEGVPVLASGLNYVPRDNYRADLHQGEAVLNASEAARWRKRGNLQSITIVNYLDGEQVGSKMKVIADGVFTNRNKRGINPMTRVYR